MRTILIDDTETDRDSLYKDLKKYCPQIKVLDQCENAEVGIDAINKYRPDLVFLDVQMPGINGIEMLQKIGKDQIHFHTIFVTKYDKYAIEAFELNAIHYLLKPFTKEKLIEAVFRTEERMKQGIVEKFIPDHDIIVLPPNGHRRYYFKIKEIVYIEAMGRNSIVYTSKPEKVEVNVLLKVPTELLMHKGFSRCHKGFLINQSHIKEFNKPMGYFLMSNGNKVPIGKTKSDKIGQG